MRVDVHLCTIHDNDAGVPVTYTVDREITAVNDGQVESVIPPAKIAFYKENLYRLEEVPNDEAIRIANEIDKFGKKT